MINKLLDEPYWEELPALIDAIGADKYLYVSVLSPAVVHIHPDRDVFHFVSQFLLSNDSAHFWQRNKARASRENILKISLNGMTEKVLAKDMAFFKEMIILAAKKSGLNSATTRPEGIELLNKIKKENNLNTSFKLLINYRLTYGLQK